jgi:hypothetical protein
LPPISKIEAAPHHHLGKDCRSTAYSVIDGALLTLNDKNSQQTGCFLDFTDDELRDADSLQGDSKSRASSLIRLQDLMREFELRAAKKHEEDAEFLDLLQMRPPEEEEDVDDEDIEEAISKKSVDQIMNDESAEKLAMDELEDALNDRSKASNTHH